MCRASMNEMSCVRTAGGALVGDHWDPSAAAIILEGSDPT